MDWIACALVVTGSYLIGSMKKVGWLFLAGGCLIWVYFGVVTEVYGLAVETSISTMVAFRGYYLWTMKERKDDNIQRD